MRRRNESSVLFYPIIVGIMAVAAWIFWRALA